MPKISSKRQITLPVDQCLELGIIPGDEYQSFVADGHITIVKKKSGAAPGDLKKLMTNPSIINEVFF